MSSESSYLNDKEYEKIVYEWNNTDTDYSTDKTIHKLFEEQVEKTPDRIAITFKNLNIAYGKLNERSNQLAHYLIQKYNITPETLIALFLDRNEHMVISILGVLKAGGAYVPVAYNYPEDRIKSILENTESRVVLVSKIYEAKLKNIVANIDAVNHTKIAVITIDDHITEEQLSLEATCNPVTSVTGNNLAYVITTSGSTGVPKLVMVEHRGVVNLRCDFIKKYALDINNQDKIETILQLANYVFDGFMEEFILSLLNGYRLLLIQNNLWTEKQKFCDFLHKNQVTHIEVTPTFASLYSFFDIPTLKRLEVAGEMLTARIRDQVHLKNGCALINAYGTTETSMVSTLALLQNENNITIGKPISNTKVYVLDDKLSPVPIGVVGELYISGVGLARGYLNRPDLTAERFIANPFYIPNTKNSRSNECGLVYSRLYKTGDLVKWLPNGNLQYIGRNDFQIKLRGLRIELEEIESVLLQYEGISQCVIIATNNTDAEQEFSESKYLIGYYVAKYKLNEKEIIKYLESKLPSYMVPTVLVYLSELPLTYNGKLDRKALPEPKFASDKNYTAPRNTIESKLCKIWSQILELPQDKVSIDDDFFRFGGNSILLIKLVSTVNNEFESDVKFKEVFNSNTIRKIAELIQNSIGNGLYKNYQITKKDSEHLYNQFCLNNVQQAYYLGRLSNFELGNISTHTYTEYKFDYLNIERLEQALNKLIERHLALRAIFINNKQQFISKVPYYQIERHKFSDENQVRYIRSQLSHKVYNPEIYPLFDIVVSQLNDHYILHISFDALLLDANSMIIFFTELTILYNNPDTELPPLAISYRDYMLRYEKIRESDVFKNSEKYWHEKLEGYNFDIGLPLNKVPSEVKEPKFKRIIKIIPAHIWHALLSKIQDENLSPISLMLAVYGKVLSYWSGQDKVCINLTLFNRLPLHPQINDLVGDFTVLELFDYNDDNKNTINNVLKRIHENFWDDIEHNLFDGIDFQHLIREKKSFSNTQIIAPVVLTSILGNDNKDQDTFVNGEVFIDNSYSGVNYSISQTSQTWLDNQVYTTKEGLVIQWDYVEQLFDQDVIEAMHSSYCKLVEDLVIRDWSKDTFPQIPTPIKDLELILSCNNESLKENHTHSPVSKIQDTLFARYEEVIRRNNLYTKIAVIDDATDTNYTYQQLLKDTEFLSKYLLDIINFKDELIGVLCTKGYNQVVSVLGIMKTGAGYLPFNTDWPITRIEEVMAQGNVKILLVSKSIYETKPLASVLGKKYKLLIVEELLLDSYNAISTEVNNTTVSKADTNNTAYVIFTSGSTGKPKGVSISHKGALNTIDAVNNKFGICDKDTILALSDLSFDLSVYDIFGLLAVGGTIVFPSQDRIKEPSYWVDLVNKYKISIWNTVPQLAELLIDQTKMNDNSCINHLRLFLLSGDWISIKLPDKIKDIDVCPYARVISLGGATEGSIWSIWYDIQKVKTEWAIIPYGTAMPKQKMYVLNTQGEHCPVGVIGEIYIGGDGVALNYYNDDELTARSFINHHTLGRLYKTGDLGRWNKCGYMEFIGRKDNQIKIRGYRVELEEIVMKLLELDGIEAAVVKIQRQMNQNYIVGYLVLKQGYNNKIQLHPSFKAVINAKLSDKLPEYMIPYDYVLIDKLPLSTNGKVDLTQLPLLDIKEQKIYVAPQSDLEKKICDIWSRILGLPQGEIGVTENFFELGGNSLFAMQLVIILNNELNYNLKLQDIYSLGNISNISKTFNQYSNYELETGVI